MLEALTTQVARLASQQPVLMVFEDAQWTDPQALKHSMGRWTKLKPFRRC
jgi:hypothetical protein